MEGDLTEIKEKALGHPRWQVRNLAVKELGARQQDPQAMSALIELINDRRPSSWWRRLLGDPFYQVGFIRRNAWQGLAKHNSSIGEIEHLISLGLEDPYYEVRTATWHLLGKLMQETDSEMSEGLKQDLRNRILNENDFEILTASLGVFDLVSEKELFISWATKAEHIKHWKVRAAYLKAMERRCRRNEISLAEAEALLQRFNLRSEYFKPVFMLKEHGSRLERSLKVEA